MRRRQDSHLPDKGRTTSPSVRTVCRLNLCLTLTQNPGATPLELLAPLLLELPLLLTLQKLVVFAALGDASHQLALSYRDCPKKFITVFSKAQLSGQSGLYME